MKRFLSYLAFGMVAGALASTWLGPKAIGWYFSPPVNIGINCRDAITWAMNKLVITQLVGLGIGCLLGFGFYFAFARKKEKPKILP